MLCTKTNADVRACLNYLQFVANVQKPGETNTAGAKLTGADVQRANMGDKDMQQSMMNLYKLIFQLPRHAQVQARYGYRTWFACFHIAENVHKS
jgi:hypothetical protein